MARYPTLRTARWHARGALIRAVAAALSIISLVVLAQPAPAQPALTPQASAAQSAAAASWPHTIQREGGTVTVYQPQAIEWPDRKRLKARAALSITGPKHPKPLMGTIELTLATTVDEAAGIVKLSDPQLISSHFPALDTQQAAALETKIRETLAQMQIREVPLASVLLSLKQLPVAAVPVNNAPPVIFYADRPASLVVFDGEPVLVPAGKSALTYAVNTNWGVFIDHGSWFLLNNGVWLSASQVGGPYQAITKLPESFQALKKEPEFGSVARYIPAKALPAKYVAPQIFVSQKPAEIIVTAGPASLRAVTGTGLQRVVNTPNVLFFHAAENLYYVLLSGRWFSARAFAGPWEFATDRLPADFSLISPTGPDAAVLASVPGTIASQEAVLGAQIPQTATLKRDAAKITVIYSGPPHFVPLPGTTLLYAVNTNTYVLQVQKTYYVCEGGAWFFAPAPAGPWILADSVPAVIYTIPPNSPLYPVTYVHVYAATPAVITFGFTAGYTLGYVSSGVLVYGTGYYYPPVIIPGPVPIFYPYPYTYAGSVWYNPSTGAWARGGTVYGPYGGVAKGGTAYNPATGAWAQGGAIYGPNGGAGAWSAYNPSTGSYAHGSSSWSNGSGTGNASYYNARTGVSGSTNQNVNPYGRWGSSTFAGPNQTVNTQSQANSNGRAGSFNSSSGAKGAGYQNAVSGGSGGAVKTQSGDVYAGHDGNVYKHTDSGWSKYSDGSWNAVQPPANRPNPPASSNNTLGATQGGTLGATQGGTLGATQGGTRGGPQGGAANGTGGYMERGNYQQLEQDRLGRQAGGGRWGGGREQSGGREFGGARGRQ
jgi:hypothetical protein